MMTAEVKKKSRKRAHPMKMKNQKPMKTKPWFLKRKWKAKAQKYQTLWRGWRQRRLNERRYDTSIHTRQKMANWSEKSPSKASSLKRKKNGATQAILCSYSLERSRHCGRGNRIWHCSRSKMQTSSSCLKENVKSARMIQMKMKKTLPGMTSTTLTHTSFYRLATSWFTNRMIRSFITMAAELTNIWSPTTASVFKRINIMASSSRWILTLVSSKQKKPSR